MSFFGGGNIVNEGPHVDTTVMGASSYGEKIKLCYGTNRIPANLIWAGTPVEHRNETSQDIGGKGGGGKMTNVTYTVSCSLVYLVCAGPVAGIRKIWGNGELIYDASTPNLSGINLSQITFSLGSETQMPPSMMQAKEGELAPAHRGVVLIHLNDYDLSEKFGNRPPSLQVETCQIATISGTQVIPGLVTIGDIIMDLCARAGIDSEKVDTTGLTQSVYGWNVDDAYRNAMEHIGDAFGIKSRDDAGTLVFYETDTLQTVATIDYTELGCSSGGASDVKQLLPITLPDEQSLPSRLTVQYQDIDRDGLSSSQTVMRTTVSSTNEANERYDFMMEASTARRIAERRLYRRWVETVTYGPLSLPPAYIGLRPGHVIKIIDDVGIDHFIRLTKVSIGADFTVKVEGVMHEAALATSYAESNSGEFTPVKLPSAGTTTARLLDLPPLVDADANTFGFYVAATGDSTAWRQAVVYQSPDAGATWNNVATVSVYALMGSCNTVLPAPLAHIGAGSIDDTNTVEVRLIKGQLVSVSDAQLLAGANLALVGNEIIQFGTATLIGAGTYRLSRLLRGVKATEDSMASHVPNELFVLLSDLPSVNLAVGSIGASLLYKVVPMGGDIVSEPVINFACSGQRIKPWQPVHVVGSRVADDLTISWFRRSRVGSALPNRADIPLDDSPEAYLVQIMNGATVVRSMTVSTHLALYTSDQQLADFGSVQASVSVRIAQVSSSFGPGKFATATI